MKRTIENAWLTVNRQCNFRCKWCYLNDTGYPEEENISLDDALLTIKNLSKLKVKSLTVTGGEPTCNGELCSIIKYAHDINMRVLVNTNGFLLSDNAYCQNICDAGIDAINISLKGYDAKNYRKNAGIDGFDKCMKAIRNVSESAKRLYVSFVLTEEIINNLLSLINITKHYGAEYFYFSLDYKFSSLKDLEECYIILNKFHYMYEKIDKETSGRFVLHQVFPLCFLPAELVANLSKKGQLLSGCQLVNGKGLVFDNHNNIIPCNALYDIILGEFKRDFSDFESLAEFIQSESIIEFYKKVSFIPHENCLECNLYDLCVGGCVLIWQKIDYNSLLSIKK